MHTSTLNPTSSSRRLAAYPCAKINLTLDVLGRRDDGYHELRSLVAGVDLRDTLTCSIAAEPGIQLDCDDPGLATPENLAYRAALELADRAGITPALRLRLQKKIPVGAGLGGGSSDAAAALQMCCQLWDLKIDRTELSAIGSRLGSDVPLFFQLPSALITGRGDVVQPVRMSWTGWALLVFAGPAVSTAEVYRAFHPRDVQGMPASEDTAAARATSAEELTAMTFNHLEPAVFRVAPVVARLYHRMNEQGFGPMRVSGAGSALYRLFDEKDQADHVARSMRERGILAATAVVAVPAGRDP